MMLSVALAAGTLSTAFGADAWPVSSTEMVVLTDTRTVAPENSISLVDLVANRLPSPADWAAASQIIANPALAIEAHRPSVARPDRQEAAVLIKQGRRFLANRDPAGARVVLERAAAFKDAEAALMLAATYDPVVLRELKVYGLAGNIAKARTWYEKAKEFGSTEASRRLEILASATR